MSQQHQCGLCLSCGAPFLPKASAVDLFRHKGNTSVLFLNMEFSGNNDIRKRYEYAKYTAAKDASHLFHDSHHRSALEYMCDHHTGDSDVTWGGPVVPSMIVQAAPNGPLPYYRTPTSKRSKGPMVAIWNRPTRANRLDLQDLLDGVVSAANTATARPVMQNYSETHALCRGCNLIMTQENDMSFHLGLGRMRASNPGPIVVGTPVRHFKASDRRVDQFSAYGTWRKATGGSVSHPLGDSSDDLTPMVAYYLHMCLPYVQPPADPDPFVQDIPNPAMQHPARSLYLQLCWIILEIACVATLRDVGRLYPPLGARSHGPQQHSGVLDLYVSFFLFRLMQFEFATHVRREGLDFIQWHQKYFWDALNCKGLYPVEQVTSLLGGRVYTSVVQPSRDLVQDIGRGLMHLYNVELRPLILFATNQHAGLPIEITAYFLPLPAMRELKARSGRQVCPPPVPLPSCCCFLMCCRAAQVIENDFQSALNSFGAAALLFRTTQLCRDCPQEFRDQLEDFRRNWQWLELERIRRSGKNITMRSAYTLYVLCCMLVPPETMPYDSGKPGSVLESLTQANLCSPWTSVLALESVGAFKTFEGEAR